MQAMAEDEAFAWELSKENVAPVHCGRNVDKLNVALAEVHSSSHHSTLQLKERELQDHIAAYTGDDPLTSWLEYYKWVQECFPSDMKKNSSVLEQITHEFKGTKKYRNDVRYMKLWVTYADKVEKPLDVFTFLYKNKIGDKLALFYIAWAFLCEKCGKIKDAETIFNRGFVKNAEPRDTLRKKYDEFNRRVSQTWTKPPEDSDETSSQQGQSTRTTQPPGRAALRPPRMHPSTSVPLENLTNTIHVKSPEVAFTVYTEPNTPIIPRPDAIIFRTSASKAPASGGRIGGSVSATARHPSPKVSAAIFEDAVHPPSSSSRKRPHSSLEVNHPRDNTKPRDVFRFNESALHDASGEEFCFEERRAMQQLVAKVAPSAFLVNASDFISKALPTTTSDPIQQAAVQDITITTKIAMNDINDMFRSPTKRPPSQSSVRIPLTEEPIIRKLQFSSFCVADDGDSTDHVAAKTPARFKPNAEENATTPEHPTTTLSNHDDPSAAKSARRTYKDVLGFSFHPYNPAHRYTIVQSEHVALSLCSMSDLVFVHDTTFDAHVPLGGKRGAKWKPQAVIRLCRASSCKLTGHLGSGSYASVYAAQLFESDASKTPMELAVKNSTLLFLQRGDKGTLHGLVNLYAQFGRRMPEPVVVHYACQMLDAVQRVHGANFVHGDIKPDNWIVVDGRSPWNHATTFGTGAVCLIDFGRAIDLQLYPPDTAFCGDCHASGFQCVEMLTKTQWTHQIDTFGLCATIHLLLFGEYMECVKMDDKWTITRRWKRYWHVELWQDLFDSFLNVPSCAHQPNLRDWRLKLHKYFTEANQKV
ncbi:hypothetical protein DYB36_003889 [Aphanomyces astaci]|uniref:BUB protein kinase n=1 Tax=Aphanomyces astaci TaxID=112090 RepID=A0A397AKV9_APHAT|nr:hypothetical protein DYB36_003889 [Aphanomyces astaci]